MSDKECCSNIKCDKATFRLITMLILTTSYFLAELIVGHITNSLSLIADSFHMLSDIVGLLVGLASTRISKWPRSSKNTFGWQRAEVVGTLINTVILATFCFTILLDAVKRFVEKERIERPVLLLSVGIGGLVINLIGLVMFSGDSGHGHSHGHSHAPKKVTIQDKIVAVNKRKQNIAVVDIVTPTSNPKDSINFSPVLMPQLSHKLPKEISSKSLLDKRKKSKIGNINKNNTDNLCTDDDISEIHEVGQSNKKRVFLHVLGDALGSVVVIISALLIWLVPGDVHGKGQWKLYIDPVLSFVMVIIISTSAIPLLYHSMLILLQSVPKEVCVIELKDQLEKIKGINKIHDLHVWKLQSDCIIGTVHIRCHNLHEYVVISQQVKKIFHNFDIHCTTIQPEFSEHTDSAYSDPSECVLDCGPLSDCKVEACCPASPTEAATGALGQYFFSLNVQNEEIPIS